MEGFQRYYKSRTNELTSAASRTKRKDTTLNFRKSSRTTIMMQKRNIGVNALTPINSPMVSVKVQNATNAASERLNKLRKWQASKKERQEEVKQKRPIFKVQHCTSSGVFDLTSIYSEIKGKPIKAVSTKKSKVHQQTPLVVSSTYKFKPPSNIKPINFKSEVDRKKPIEQLTKRVTRSSARNVPVQRTLFEGLPAAGNGKDKKPKRQLVKKDNNPEKKLKDAGEVFPVFLPRSAGKTPKRRTLHNWTIEQIDDKPNVVEVNTTNQSTIVVDDGASVNPSSKSAITPKTNVENVVYVSPFVTMSRGKDNARKEYFRRRTLEGSKQDRSTSPEAAAAYFYNLLEAQKVHLKQLCLQWNSFKEETNLPEEACEMIDVAVGQTELLLTKKFQQFQNLIDSCIAGDSEKPITCFDLHGFWDMVSIQVDNLNKRFENLVTLKENDWKEILPEVPSLCERKTKQKTKPKGAAKKVTSTKGSALRAMIQKERAKKETALLDVQQSSSSTVRTLRTRSRMTLNATTPVNSPGLSIMRVTHAAKSAEKPVLLENEAEHTPRGILKSGNKESLGRKSKSVLFNKENFNSPYLITFS